MSITKVLLTGNLKVSGRPAAGTVTFELNHSVINSDLANLGANPVTVPRTKRTAILDTAGNITDTGGTIGVVLDATDDPDTVPPGPVTYHVTIDVTGILDEFDIVITSTAPLVNGVYIQDLSTTPRVGINGGLMPTTNDQGVAYVLTTDNRLLGLAHLASEETLTGLKHATGGITSLPGSINAGDAVRRSDLAVVTTEDPKYAAMTSNNKLINAWTDAAAKGLPLRINKNYTITGTISGLPASVGMDVDGIGSLTQGTIGSSILQLGPETVDCALGLRWVGAVGAPVTAASGNSAIVAVGDGVNYGSGPNGLRIKPSARFTNFNFIPVDVAGVDGFTLEDGCQFDGNYGACRLTGCRDFYYGAAVITDKTLRWPSSTLQTPIYLNSTDQNGYGVCNGGTFGSPRVDGIPGAELLIHAGKNIGGRVVGRHIGEGMGVSLFNNTDVGDNIHLDVDITLIAPWNITAATWAAMAGGQATFTLGTALTASGDSLHLAVGQTVTVAGMNPAGYNGAYTILSMTGNGGNGSTITVALVSNPGAFVSAGTVAFTLGVPANVGWSIGGGSGLTEAAQTVTAAGVWDGTGYTLTMASTTTFGTQTGTVTLTGFTPAGLNGTWQYDSKTSTTIRVRMPNAGTVTVEGTAGYVNPPRITNSSIRGIVRNSNAVAQNANWGGGHVGYADNFTESVQYDNCYGCGVNVTNPCTALNLGSGSVYRNTQAVSGNSASVQVLSQAAGSTGRIGGFVADGATNVIRLSALCPGLLIQPYQRANITGAEIVNPLNADITSFSLFSGPVQINGGASVYSDSGAPTATAKTGPAIVGDRYDQVDGSAAKKDWILTTRVASTIAAGSNGQTLPQATIHLASTAGMGNGGFVHIKTDQGWQAVAYSGLSGNDLTGCTGGLGTMSTGGLVNFQTWQCEGATGMTFDAAAVVDLSSGAQLKMKKPATYAADHTLAANELWAIFDTTAAARAATLPAAPAPGIAYKVSNKSGTNNVTVSPNSGQTFANGHATDVLAAAGDTQDYEYDTDNTQWWKV